MSSIVRRSSHLKLRRIVLSIREFFIYFSETEGECFDFLSNSRDLVADSPNDLPKSRIYINLMFRDDKSPVDIPPLLRMFMFLSFFCYLSLITI